jgi:hypothetical protein
MVAITAGTGSTLKSTTAEALLAECLDYLQLQETTSARNPNLRDYVRINYDCNSYLFSGTFNFPYLQSQNSLGEKVSSVPDYLSGVTFSPGTGGTFKSVNPAAFAFEVATFLDIVERDVSRNQANHNRISLTEDNERLIVSGTVTLPFVLSPNADGSRKMTITPYLT